MFIDAELKVVLLDRDGVKLAHVEAGPTSAASPPLVFIHGWQGHPDSLLPQILHFSKIRRVVAVHLRGHGDSDAPVQDYTIAGFADDIAWQCRQLKLEKPVIVGTSLGGVIALELAGRHTDLPSGIVMIDSVIFSPPDYKEAARRWVAVLNGPGFRAAVQAMLDKLYQDHVDIDDPKRKERLLGQMLEWALRTPRHVGISTFINSLNGHDPLPAAKACKVPVVYLTSGVPVIEKGCDLVRFQEACPQLVVAKTFGSGHMSQLEVPDQINAMIARFIAVGIDRRPS